LDQFDIRFPASHSFISYPIACEAVQFCAPPTFLLSGGHTAFPIREWLCYGPGFKTRRILSCVLQEQEAPILRGNLGISGCKLKILKRLGLRGGPDRDRTDDLFHAMLWVKPHLVDLMRLMRRQNRQNRPSRRYLLPKCYQISNQWEAGQSVGN
jgi:hypothetical protein